MLTGIMLLAPADFGRAQVSVLTYHNDSWRSGLNAAETRLNYATVAKGFGLLGTLAVDDQVDAQPLVVANGMVAGDPNPGSHDVVYVVTENNSVYAIDPVHQSILAQVNLGTPVPMPLGCNNNGPNVGINSTPVIDKAQNALFVMAYVSTATGPHYMLHALSLTTLADTLPPVTVTASTVLADGKTVANFNATYQRQRPALLEAAGVVYAAFGSFCDYAPTLSRGWLLGWQATTLAPLRLQGKPAVQQAYTPLANLNGFLLGSIWMSGFGPAYDPVAGGIYFVTANGAPGGYNGKNSVQESAVRYSRLTNAPLDIFTPYDQSVLDQHDTDFGSGGLMLLAPHGAVPTLAVAAGKAGTMYLMQGSKLGGYTPGGPDAVLSAVTIGPCWCGPSTFNTAHGPVVVSSGGNTVELWHVQTAPTPALVQGASAGINDGPNARGFFTTVSSNGFYAPIIWAVGRPLPSTNTVTLYALQAAVPDGTAHLPVLFHAPAGVWPNSTGKANLSATVANGYVYVASNKQLAIFGLTGPQAAPRERAARRSL